ncbi:MAG: hypothetical protein ABI821_15830 [Pseudomonadota bacterium]
MNPTLLRQPCALVPLAMSAIALALVMWHWASGSRSPADEGAAAHLFQLCIVGQAPFAAYFAARWMPKEPGPAMLVLALQAAAAVAALVPVVLFDL